MLKHYILFAILIASTTNLYAQKKLSFDINVGALHSISSDVLKEYNSSIQPLKVIYFSRKKFEQPYLNILTGLNYSMNPKISLGLQSGLYVHFYERYFGYTKSISVSIPLMATFGINILNLKKNTLGINLSGGGNFFYFNAYQTKLKNGVLYNASVFCITHQKRIIKLGLEREVDNEYMYFVAENSFSKDETIKFHLNRLSLMLSYGFSL